MCYQSNPDGMSTDLLVDYTGSCLSRLSAAYASVMPRWIPLSFFDPEMERTRVDVHDHQAQNNIKELRKTKDCRLVDELVLPLKSSANFLQAATHALNLGLDKYLAQLICPRPGDWLAQFFMRYIQLNVSEPNFQLPNFLQADILVVQD